jgi:hypothetical protein
MRPIHGHDLRMEPRLFTPLYAFFLCRSDDVSFQLKNPETGSLSLGLKICKVSLYLVYTICNKNTLVKLQDFSLAPPLSVERKPAVLGSNAVSGYGWSSASPHLGHPLAQAIRRGASTCGHCEECSSPSRPPLNKEILYTFWLIRSTCVRKPEAEG